MNIQFLKPIALASLFLFCSFTTIQAQHKNNLALEIPFSSRKPFSLNYARQVFKTKELIIYVKTGVGLSQYNNQLEQKYIPATPIILNTGDLFSTIVLSSIFNIGNTGTTLNRTELINVNRYMVGGEFLLGSQQHSLEFGLNVAIDNIKIFDNDEIRNTQNSSNTLQCLLKPSIAFRYESKKGFLFKIGCSVDKVYGFYNEIQPHAFISFGGAF